MDEVLIHFRLTGPEAKALRELALAQTRRPNEQVRFMIRHELAFAKAVREGAEVKTEVVWDASR